MKKISPWFIVLGLFLIVYIGQIFIVGPYSSASKLDKDNEKIVIFESLYEKLNFTTTRGTTYNLAQHKDKIVILNFWASWCQPCLAEFASLKKLVEKYPKDKLLVIGINNDEEDAFKAIVKTEKKLNLNFESVIDNNSTTTSKFFISAIPASIAFYKGKVIHYVNKEFNFMDQSFLETLDKAIEQ